MSAINKIDGDARTVRALLGEKYGIDYYQREYRWEQKHVDALLQDIETRFMASYDPGDSRPKVRDYAHYFLGPIVVSHKGGQRFLIDGQQRLTTLTLLLIYLNHVQSGYETKVPVDELIYSERYGEKSFHLDVEERRECMQALFDGRDFAPPASHGSVATLVERYADIEDLLGDELATPATLPYFLDWLLDNVELVEITTYNDEDAYAIFETMNDRGLSLTPAEMLKGYLLSKLDTQEARAVADELWRRKVVELKEWGEEEDADFLKAWLRAQYARTIRERKRGASNQDFEHIGSSFHKWVRDNGEQHLGLRTSTEFAGFIDTQFKRFADSYLLLSSALWEQLPGLEYLFYNAASGFTLQPALLLAPLTDQDDEASIRLKFRLVAGYIDIFIFRRVINFRTLAYSSIQYTMFNVIRDIRRKSVPELAEILAAKAAVLDLDDAAAGEYAPLDGILTFRLHQQNKNHVRNLLARLTAHLEQEAGRNMTFAAYVDRERADSYDIEHIWADKPERHTDEFADEHGFSEYRNRLGGLLLLPPEPVKPDETLRVRI
jgi:quinol monooxygenase YgiN